jgi:hypothetical protein
MRLFAPPAADIGTAILALLAVCGALILLLLRER